MRWPIPWQPRTSRKSLPFVPLEPHLLGWWGYSSNCKSVDSPNCKSVGWRTSFSFRLPSSYSHHRCRSYRIHNSPLPNRCFRSSFFDSFGVECKMILCAQSASFFQTMSFSGWSLPVNVVKTKKMILLVINVAISIPIKAFHLKYIWKTRDSCYFSTWKTFGFGWSKDGNKIDELGLPLEEARINEIGPPSFG